jgi:hypothetical protein
MKMDTKYNLIVCIVNSGFSELVMEAARNAGATGGTILNARGTVKEEAASIFNIPIHPEKDMIYIMFTDQNLNNKRTNWTIINVEHNFNYSNKLEVIKKQRFYKTYPHLLFKDYNLSIYIDSTFDIKGNLDEFLLRILTKSLSIYILEHPNRNSINNIL